MSRFITALRLQACTPASVYASSTRRPVCIIQEIIALYSQNASKTISEGLKSKILLGGGMPSGPPCGHATCAFMRSAYCWKPPLQISSYACAYCQSKSVTVCVNTCFHECHVTVCAVRISLGVCQWVGPCT